MASFIRTLWTQATATAAKLALVPSIVARTLRNQSGASAAEYALILAIVGSAIALAAIFLGGVIGAAINEAGTCITSNGSTCS